MALLSLWYSTLIGILATAGTFLDNVKPMPVSQWVVSCAGSVWHRMPNVSNMKCVNPSLFGTDTSTLKSPTTATGVVTSQLTHRGPRTPKHFLRVLNAKKNVQLNVWDALLQPRVLKGLRPLATWHDLLRDPLPPYAFELLRSVSYALRLCSFPFSTAELKRMLWNASCYGRPTLQRYVTPQVFWCKDMKHRKMYRNLA